MTSSTIPLRLEQVVGFGDRKNDVVYGKPVSKSDEVRVVIFFPGDVQDYIENMEAHRDNRHYKDWNLESCASKLQKKFPNHHILVIKPLKMGYKTFSCFQNFVSSGDVGVPTHSPNYNSLRHLNCLIKGVEERLINSNESSCSSNNEEHNRQVQGLAELDLVIIGFSKGCVVLNQFLYEIHNAKTQEPDEELGAIIITRIRDMYWLDGGHSGGKNSWITDVKVLQTLSSLDINIHVHLSPYQIEDIRRPWIKKEEKLFSDRLLHYGCNLNRKVHFEGVPPSILTHFDVLNDFKKTP